MKLLYQTHSPFARKALVFAYEAGLAERIEVVHNETSPTQRNDEVYHLNPLGKVPVLISDDDEAIFDSGVICSYLDTLNMGDKLIPSNDFDRIAALRLQALADGMSETGILARWESVRRPEKLRYKPLYDGLVSKLVESYDYIENNILLSDVPRVGEIALATSLSWLAFRELPPFQDNRPKLAAWYHKFEQRDSMMATTLIGDTYD